MKKAKRIEQLPPYLFADLDRKINDARSTGVDVISFAVGDPDLPTPDHIVEAGAKAMRDPANHQYPSYYGMAEFREAEAHHYAGRFGVKLDPQTQILALIGSKEGIAHLASAFVDPGDKVLIPDPGYPVYETSAILSGGEPVMIPLEARSGYFPQLDGLRGVDAKLLWLCYPNNPTSAVCDVKQLEAAVSFCSDHDILLAHDAAYTEITYDGFVAPSVLQVPGAIQTAVEFGSLSKTYNMTGWRVGWVAGASEAIEALGRVKTNIDSGIFNALQYAGIAALSGPQECVSETVRTYAGRRDRLIEGLGKCGIKAETPKGSIYLWAPVPDGYDSAGFTSFLLENAGVVVSPGSGYGKSGEGYVRFSLTVPDDRLAEGAARITEALGR